MRCMLFIVISIYLLISFTVFGIGVHYANFTYVGSCKKKNTYIGVYTGLSYVYNFGCRLGKYTEEE